MNITNGATATAGEEYTLTCSVMEVENLDATIDTVWTLPNGRVVESTTDQLHLNPLRVSDGGVYTCRVNISSLFLNSTISSSGSYSVTVKSKCSIASTL